MPTYTGFYCTCVPAPTPGMFNLPQLHNAWIVDFSDGTHTFHSVDQYVQWRKALLFGDTATAQQILETPAADMTMWRVLGRRMTGFVSATWRAAAQDIGKEGMLLKFGQHEDLKALLLGTGDAVLVCDNNYDRYWGAGTGNPDCVSKPETWQGRNWCGNALMEVRAALNLQEA